MKEMILMRFRNWDLEFLKVVLLFVILVLLWYEIASEATQSRNDAGLNPSLSLTSGNDAGAAERGLNQGDEDREGEGVYRRIRHRRTIYKYADWL